MSDMQVSLEAGSGLERRMRVQVPAGRIEQEVEARLRDAGRSASLKGFRRGKAPAHVIRQRFGAQIRQEVLQDVVQSSYSEAIAKENLRPVAAPAIEADPLESGKDFSFTAVFEIYPEFKVEGLDRLSVERPEIQVDETDIDRTVDRLRRQKGNWKTVDRPAAQGDRLVVDFVGRLNGEAIEGGKAELLEIVIGEGRMLEEFETSLVGMLRDEEKSFAVRFPADYHEPKLRDQDVVFDVRVSDIAELELPPLESEFIKGCGAVSGELGELRWLIRQSLEREAASRVQADVRRQIMEQLLAGNPVEVPAVMVDREAVALQSDGMRNLGLKNAQSAPPADAYREVAKRRVRLGLIIGALIREYDLKIDEARVDNRLDELCQSYDRPEEAKKLYLQSPVLMERIENSVMEEQAMAWLVDRAQVTSKPVALSDLFE